MVVAGAGAPKTESPEPGNKATFDAHGSHEVAEASVRRSSKGSQERHVLAAIHTVSVEDFVAARDEIHEDRNTHRGAATHREVTPAHVNSVNVGHFLGVRECTRIFAGPHYNGAVTALLMGFALIILFQMVFFLPVLVGQRHFIDKHRTS
jgi:hypothetical protein